MFVHLKEKQGKCKIRLSTDIRHKCIPQKSVVPYEIVWQFQALLHMFFRTLQQSMHNSGVLHGGLALRGEISRAIMDPY